MSNNADSIDALCLALGVPKRIFRGSTGLPHGAAYERQLNRRLDSRRRKWLKVLQRWANPYLARSVSFSGSKYKATYQDMPKIQIKLTDV